ncbi:hypothetical protein GUJ93_ZPchr0013g34651 [Zizania palustris]|uniref:BZIP domain-containing protein n=1 Tax=Zizania palustris TaxID=103762 RepID=A0A8J5X6U1_ZIZPA|nr:hypothetical protein GUJ93_ZPchr0013g34651 [Zizania palustris]
MASSAASPSSSKSDDDRRSDGVPRHPAATVTVTHAEWAASMQAYYAAGGHPYAWPPPPVRNVPAFSGIPPSAVLASGFDYGCRFHDGTQQHLMAVAAAAYGAPVPFPVYHPAYYAHASMAAGVSRSHMAGGHCGGREEQEEDFRWSLRRGLFREVGFASACQCWLPICLFDDLAEVIVVFYSGDGGSDESSEKRDADADQKDLSSAKRRTLGHANVEGEGSEAAMTEKNAVAQSPFVSPRKAAPNLHIIGMDIWNTSAMAAVPSGQAEVNVGAPLLRDNALSQMQDERELKRERRKQSNRESARRSRLRKQQECEELSQKVTDLTAINSALRSELDELKKDCEDMEAENSQLMDEMVQSEGSRVKTTLSIKVDNTSKEHHACSGQINKRTS